MLISRKKYAKLDTMTFLKGSFYENTKFQADKACLLYGVFYDVVDFQFAAAFVCDLARNVRHFLYASRDARAYEFLHPACRRLDLYGVF